MKKEKRRKEKKQRCSCSN